MHCIRRGWRTPVEGIAFVFCWGGHLQQERLVGKSETMKILYAELDEDLIRGIIASLVVYHGRKQCVTHSKNGYTYLFIVRIYTEFLQCENIQQSSS